MSNRKKAEPAPEVSLPITPMLDMAFQLLTFFIFTYHPSALEGQMEMALPTEEQTKKADKPDDVDPFKQVDKTAMPEMQIELTVVVEERPNGYTISLEEGVARSQHDSVESLLLRLKDIFKNRQEKIKERLKDVPAKDYDKKLAEEIGKLGVKVQGSAGLRWGDVVRVMDVCRLAGFTTVSCAPPPGFRQGAPK
jgi:biopolymer transport protein ExbD